ncbi:sulfotransferase [Marinoscillum sp. MHG1-6]|uniref:sulfotransferase n=1 Tax=Marinoscillum sp. MHG1-6 TaxID=2959627 RepID=UPI00215808A8|nr:sulfotransferase [Marinoscillum sp. MHG1-6]
MKIFGIDLRLRKKERPKNVVSDEVVQKNVSDPDFPYLVSFSRTGSHWLRILTESYFDIPSLKLIFEEKNYRSSDFLYFHTHDMDLKTERSRVVYLYRNPVPTVFSQMKYYKTPMDDKSKIEEWATLYAKHLDKWLFSERFTHEKLIITYEDLKSNPERVFKKLSEFFGRGYDKEKVAYALNLGTKENIKAQTTHDSQVINVKEDYEDLRKEFEEQNKEFIFNILEKVNPDLKSLFDR